jgi:hypothetical protein
VAVGLIDRDPVVEAARPRRREYRVRRLPPSASAQFTLPALRKMKQSLPLAAASDGAKAAAPMPASRTRRSGVNETVIGVFPCLRFPPGEG